MSVVTLVRGLVSMETLFDVVDPAEEPSGDVEAL